MDLHALDQATVIRRPAKLPAIPQRDWAVDALALGCLWVPLEDIP